MKPEPLREMTRAVPSHRTLRITAAEAVVRALSAQGSVENERILVVRPEVARDVVAKEIYHRLNIYGVNKRVHNFGAHPLELVDLTDTWAEPKR